MPIIKLHYDGWLVLPAGLRQALGLGSGDRLDAALVDGVLVLRPVPRSRRVTAAPDAAPAGIGDPETPAPAADDGTARRRVGRPRKAASVEGDEGAAPTRPRGRPRKVARADDSAMVSAAETDLGPPRLRKKADRDAGKPAPEAAVPAPPPARVIRPVRVFQPVEHHPFRNVEVRPLGPGRGHNKG